MRVRAAPLTFFVALAFALVVYFGAVRRLDAEVATRRAELLAVDLASIDERRIADAPGKGAAELLEAADRVEANASPTSDVWSRWGSGPAPSDLDFRREFRNRVGRLESTGVLGLGAWPEYTWESIGASPTPAECRRTARLFVLVRGLSELLRPPEAKVDEKIRVIALRADSDDVRLTIDFDPERSSELLASLVGGHIGGEPFELVSLETAVGDVAGRPGTATVQLRMPR